MPRPVTLVPVSTLPETEHDDARRYWAERGLRKSYWTPLPYRTFIAQKVLAESPKRVLELGPNVGLNLKTIRDLDPTVDLVGIDVNVAAVEKGRKDYGLDLFVAKDSIEWLEAQPDDSFDVAYTVSVLDHIAKPNETLKQLARIAPVLLLIEPWFGKEGKIRQADISGTAPYSYSWNYAMRLGRYGMTVESAEPYILSTDERTLGPDYVLYTCRRKGQKVAEPVPEPEPTPVPEPEPTVVMPPVTFAGTGTMAAPEAVIVDDPEEKEGVPV